jgi:hypothetical protein
VEECKPLPRGALMGHVQVVGLPVDGYGFAGGVEIFAIEGEGRCLGAYTRPLLQLNVSTFCGIEGAYRGYLGGV